MDLFFQKLPTIEKEESDRQGKYSNTNWEYSKGFFNL